jgi:hypothetical protein
MARCCAGSVGMAIVGGVIRCASREVHDTPYPGAPEAPPRAPEPPQCGGSWIWV